jgi:hypothetical protein
MCGRRAVTSHRPHALPARAGNASSARYTRKPHDSQYAAASNPQSTGNRYAAGQRRTGNEYLVGTWSILSKKGAGHHERHTPEQHVKVPHLSDAALSNQPDGTQT